MNIHLMEETPKKLDLDFNLEYRWQINALDLGQYKKSLSEV